MSDHAYEAYDDVLPNEPNGELVHWMSPRPMALGPTGISMTAASAFVIGAAATLAVLALVHWIGPERKVALPKRRWRSAIDWI
jgi:hypothetical protein